MKARALSGVAAIVVWSGLGCATRATEKPGVHMVEAAPAGDVAELVRQAQSSVGDGNLLVYVGATWCEPCQRFHAAAEAGQLDAAFPHLRLLVFDLDRDGARLAAAGYASEYIPLFARPGADGRGSGKAIAGSIKGDGAVSNIVPRLTALLNQP